MVNAKMAYYEKSSKISFFGKSRNNVYWIIHICASLLSFTKLPSWIVNSENHHNYALLARVKIKLQHADLSGLIDGKQPLKGQFT